jgi:hypothetical protein
MEAVLLVAVAAILKQPISLQWYAPFFSGSGYGHEAINFMQSLDKTVPTSELKINLEIHQFGGPNDTHFIRNVLTQDDESLLARLNNYAHARQSTVNSNRRIIICHSLPNLWVDRQLFGGGSYPELAKNVFTDGQCPPENTRDSDYIIGRYGI